MVGAGGAPRRAVAAAGGPAGADKSLSADLVEYLLGALEDVFGADAAARRGDHRRGMREQGKRNRAPCQTA